MNRAPTITSYEVIDLRFPTSDEAHGSDAMHADPDYSAAYVVLRTDVAGLEGHGLTFTLGRGTDVCVAAAERLCEMTIGLTLAEITRDFANFWRRLTSESQLRWLGPEKGVVHLATAAVVNAIWDLWAKAEGKPVWKLVADLTPEQLIGCIDFRYLGNALTRDEALRIVEANEPDKADREQRLRADGFPAYTTSAGWLGYSDDQIRQLCREAIADGWNAFKLKVGADQQDDRRRAALIREEIGPHRRLMIDANQRWEVGEAIEWVRALAEFDLWWVEEPTSPDDVVGHAEIARAIAPIGVATGEQCQNRVIFKQFLQLNAIAFCQIDSCRLGGLNEVLAVMLLAKKFGVPVCPHAGGVGLCEYVNHLIMIDYLRIGASLENRVCEFVDHLHEHFVDPCVVTGGAYRLPQAPGYSAQIHPETLAAYRYPDGPIWRERLGAKP
ncbi:L-fuconate dehydratase [Botrimarina hoheduenensis]|uniref:L-fuconate dehydratase n=1 Tax=Botrimarina hoheduenensis TaxID=2528000 RepID=A0A5C5WA73_9BACT|nr:L-fuconate dehydratase [Botrimarina hoheduenensis]TWT47560.1 L-fuconate dehydratase [Botrimarina hoheduenensis]